MNVDETARNAAQAGLRIIECAIIDLLEHHPEGLGNAEIARSLGLQSDFRGSSRNFLTYSVLGGLLAQGRVTRDEKTKKYVNVTPDVTEEELAQRGLSQIESAIIALLERNPQGLRNIEIAEALHLLSNFQGGSRNYLTYSVLGGLLKQGRVTWNEETKIFTKA